MKMASHIVSVAAKITPGKAQVYNYYSINFQLSQLQFLELLKEKQNLGVTFNFDKQDVIDFTKFSKMTMCRASEANS